MAQDSKYALATTSGNDFLTKFSTFEWDAFCLAHLFTRQGTGRGCLQLLTMTRDLSSIVNSLHTSYQFKAAVATIFNLLFRV